MFMMHEEMHQGTGEKEQERQEIEDMLSMLRKEEQADAEEGWYDQPEKVDRNPHLASSAIRPPQ